MLEIVCIFVCSQTYLWKYVCVWNEWQCIFFYSKLEDDPRSTPGHSKVLDQIRAIMKLMIVVSTVGLTKKLLRCYVDVQKHLKQLLKDSNQSLCSFIHLLRFELYTLLKMKSLRVCLSKNQPRCPRAKNFFLEIGSRHYGKVPRD